MRRIAGDLDPRLDLATTDGRVLVSNDDNPAAEGTLDAGIIHYTVLENSMYLIVATRFGFQAGSTEGNFVLEISQTAPETLGASPAEARLIDYGAALSGTIDDDTPQRYFRFDARRGDVVTVSLDNASGNLDPLLVLLDSDLVELARDDNSGDNRGARILAFTLPRNGVYYLVATRFGEQTGQTRGEFVLQVNGRAGIVGGRALEIIYGATVSGIIDDANLSEEYVFFGREGDVITIVMERASGDLDCLVTLLDSERKQIAFDDDTGEQQNSLIARFELPRDDMYILVASRFDREIGATSGAYILTLELDRAGNN
jgi:hypothetical protein